MEKDGLLTYPTIDATFDIIFPWVEKVDPPDNSTNKEITTSISATFNEPMRISTITDSTFVLRDSNTNNHKVHVTINFDSDRKIATFKPTNNLSFNKWYRATITTEVTDEKGNPMLFEKKWSFKTKESSPSVT